MLKVFGLEVEAKVGGVVRFDGENCGRRLMEGDAPTDESYPGCQFRLSSNVLQGGVPCNVTITGRTVKRYGGELWVRCEVEFVKDGELSSFEKGWLLV